MPEPTLTPRTPLDGFHREYSGVSLSEITDCALVSIAVPLGGAVPLEQKMTAAFDAGLPASGSSTVSKDGRVRFLGLQTDQMFALFAPEGDDAAAELERALGDTGYYTDQSDSWVMLSMSGPLARTALERICLLDLDPGIFAQGAVTRTMMEHLAAIILRDGPDSFLLMSPRSSARSFLHALETSIDYVL